MPRRNCNENLLWAILLAASATMIAAAMAVKPPTSGTTQTMRGVVESQEQQVPVSLGSTAPFMPGKLRRIGQVMGRIQQVMVREGTTSGLGKPWWCSTMRRCARKLSRRRRV